MTDKSKKIIYIVIGVIIVLVIAYFALKPAKSVAQTSGDGSNMSGNGSINESAFPLKKGSRGEEVRRLQNYLISKYGGPSVLPMFGADGVWGDETDSAVKKHLQRDNVSLDVFKKWGI